MKNLEQYPIEKEVKLTKEDLVNFEKEISELWQDGKIKGPVHLSGGNEDELIRIFSRIKTSDWVFSTWRSHYHALLHEIPPEWLKDHILDGKSITIVNKKHKFYSSAIVGGTLSIAVGAAMSNKRLRNGEIVWCFIGDMCFESGLFYEAHKYAVNYDLPIRFIVEDNGVSTNTPTHETWGNKSREVPSDVIWYQYKNPWPHYGTGKWVTF